MPCGVPLYNSMQVKKYIALYVYRADRDVLKHNQMVVSIIFSLLSVICLWCQGSVDSHT